MNLRTAVDCQLAIRAPFHGFITPRPGPSPITAAFCGASRGRFDSILDCSSPSRKLCSPFAPPRAWLCKHESATFAVYALGHVVEITPTVVKRYQTDRRAEKAGSEDHQRRGAAAVAALSGNLPVTR
jgi:hypothetical protein